MKNEWLTRQEFCQALDISEKTLYRHVKQGKVKFCQIIDTGKSGKSQNDKIIVDLLDMVKAKDNIIQGKNELIEKLRHFENEYYELQGQIKQLKPAKHEIEQRLELEQQKSDQLLKEIDRLKLPWWKKLFS